MLFDSDLQHVWQTLQLPFFFPLLSSQRIYWLYLFGAFVMTYALFLNLKNHNGVDDDESIFSFAFPKSIYTHRSTRNDVVFFILNTILFNLTLTGLLFWVEATVTLKVSNWLSMIHFPGEALFACDPIVGNMVLTVVTLLAMDFGVFLGHYLQHKLPWLWEFHKTHHTAEVLSPITVYRMHPMDDTLTYALVGLLVGTTTGIFHYLSPGDGIILKIYGLNIGVALFYLLGYNLRHSHIWLSYGPWWSRIFISPAQHQIHHSKLKHHHDKNFGLIFAWWDAWFQTLYIPTHREKLVYGIDTDDHKDYQSVMGMYFQPFMNIARSWSWQKAFQPKALTSVIVIIAIIAVAMGLNQSVIAAYHKVPPAVYLENLTWKDVQNALNSGTRTVIIPTGGTEQNGLHVILGKHNYIVHYTAGRIAERLGHTLVAPVLPYVPEGSITPPEGHMRYSGTLSIPESVFEAVLTHTAESLKQHGFKTICFVGDSGGNQAAQQRVADALTKAWNASGVRVVNVNNYYAHNHQISDLLNSGYRMDEIGTHASVRDTSELMAVYPPGVHLDRVRPGSIEETGSDGSPKRATVQLGRLLLEKKITAAVRQIRPLMP